MPKVFLLGLVCWGLATALVQAEPGGLSFPQAFQQSDHNHPRLLQLRQQIALAEARLPQAAAGLNPEVTLTNEDFLGSASWTPDRFTQFTLEWAQTFWLTAQPALRERVAAQQIVLLRWEYLLAQRQIWLELQQHFHRLPYLEQQGHLAQKLVAQATEQVALTQRLVTLGRMAPAELWSVEVALQQEEAAAKHWQALLQQERLRLVRFWGGEPAEAQGVLPPELPREQPTAGSLKAHPRLLRWDTLKQLRQEMLALSQAEALPPVTLSGGPRFHPPADWGVLFSVRAPVPVLNANQGEIAAAQLALAQLPQEYAQEYKALQQEWQEAYLAWQAAQEQVILLQAQHERLGQMAAQARQILAAGKQTALAVLTIEQAVVRKQQQWLEAQQTERQAALRCYAFLPQLWPMEALP